MCLALPPPLIRTHGTPNLPPLSYHVFLPAVLITPPALPAPSPFCTHLCMYLQHKLYQGCLFRKFEAVGIRKGFRARKLVRWFSVHHGMQGIYILLLVYVCIYGWMDEVQFEHLLTLNVQGVMRGKGWLVPPLSTVPPVPVRFRGSTYYRVIVAPESQQQQKYLD